MKGPHFRYLQVILTVTVILLAFAAESIYFSDFEYRYRNRLFNKKLAAKEKIMEDCLNAMKPIITSDDHLGSISENNIFSIAEQNNISILEFFDKKLVHWSDNGFDVPPYVDDSLYVKPLVFLQNGWFLTQTIQAGNEKIVGLLRLHTDYGFENDIIKNGFEKEYHIPQKTGFSTDKDASPFHIYNKKGEFLFSLIFPEKRENTYFILIPFLLWTFAFILIILLTLRIAKILLSRKKSWLTLLLILVVYTFIYLLFLFTRKPSVLFNTELFSHVSFSFNTFIPSLGHLIMISLLISSLSFFYFNHIHIPELQKENRRKNYLLLTFLLTCGALLFCCCNIIFGHLILNSNISFETYKVLELSMFSIAGYASVILLLTLPVLFVIKTFQSGKQVSRQIVIFSIFSSLLIPVIFLYKDPDTLIPFGIFYIIMVFSLWLTGFHKPDIFNRVVIYSIIFGVYSLYIITNLSEEKVIDNLKIQAVSFSTDNDPEAEHLILDLWPVLKNDSSLVNMMNVDYFDKFDFDRITSYLQETYFTGYWHNFNFSVVLCRNDETIRIGQDDNVSENCFDFYENRIHRNGHLITGTGFYFIDNQGGRTYYIGRLFSNAGRGATNGLFIELYSDVNVFQPGYSELLLDKKFHGYAGLKDYSFAKYINGEIVLRTGEFPYNKTDYDYVEENSDYKIFKHEGFKHVLYKNSNSTVLISRPELKSEDIIISFAYLFAFILLFVNLLLLINRRPDLKVILNFNFRQKLQLSFIGILLFSFLLIGIVVASFTIRQYQTKQNDAIKDKLNSIYLELENKISNEKHLSADWRNSTYLSLNGLLINLSNVFNTDINLYDLNGFLIATSRPEIFYRDLTSRRINIMAFINLKDLTRSEYYQKEKIGSLEYISAYVPYFNNENNIIAYLNLPYFRMQSVLAKEISNLIVAVINFTLLLIIITMTLAVIISGRLTSPLMMLGEGLASVGVGRKSEHLTYKGRDEIGALVKQYNRMVDEIEESTNRLANSEREYAWREMAKQIAHEIKNPLTPMKLNVQQLFKSWRDKVPGFERELERFTKNQIEYIDNLSSIASAFSSFAKMPGTNPMEVDLADQVRVTLELFKDTDNVTFEVKWPSEQKVVIYADKEQLNGIFSNLIKNGIQSIPAGREGVIKVSMEINGSKVIVSISDNGTGISEDMQKKLFTPNFTTKSSGMGLGLSIVKKYVESANGRIWFESLSGNGTIFYVELPLKYTVEKLG